MKLFGFLRKPGWENTDPAVRLRAVQSGDDAALRAQLPAMAQADPDPDVRMAALRRVDDPNLLARRMRGDLDPRVAAVARDRLVACLCDPALPLDARRAAMLDLPDPDVLARVAERAPDAELRRAALEHIARPGFLFERCLKDPEPALRLWLLERIEGPEALQRLADAARKRDKALARAARERLDALLLAGGDAAALERATLAVCERASRLARELPADREHQLAALRDEWEVLSARVPDDLARRAQGALTMAAAAIEASRAQVVSRAPAPALHRVPAHGETTADARNADTDGGDEAPGDDAGATAVVDGTADDAGSSPPVDQAAVTAADSAADTAAGVGADPGVHPADDAAALRQRQAQERREARAAAAVAALDAMDQALEANSLAAARSARAGLDRAGLSPGHRHRLAALDERLAKLDQWQRWSGNEVRRRLCDDTEALQGSGLHPDALANRVKELQAEWARLDAIDGNAAPATDGGLSRRFRALCHAALKPARGYFEKRREVRGERAGQVEALLADAAATIEGADPAALPPLRRRITEALRDLDSIAPEKRGEHGRALRDCLGRIDAGVAAGREQAALEKRRIIARLRRDLGAADADAAVALAKEAQATWKRLARGERKQDEALWTELRALVDPLFASVKEREDMRRQQATQADAAAREVLQEMRALAAADDARLAHAEAHLEALQARWRALEPVEEPASTPGRESGRGQRGARAPQRGSDRGRSGERERRAPRRGHPLEAEFSAALASVQAARQRAAAQREASVMQAICRAGELLDRLGAGADDASRIELRAAFDALELPQDARAALQARVTSTATHGAAAGAEQDAVAARAEALAVRAELVAGLESPPEAAAIRRAEQMQRLAARLEGSGQRAPREEIRGLLIALQAEPGIGKGRVPLQQRIVRAWEAVAGTGG